MALEVFTGFQGNFEDGATRSSHLPDKLHTLEDEVDIFDAVTSGRPTRGDLFGSLRLSPTGGITEVGALFKWPRYLSAMVFVVLLVANTYTLLRKDVPVMFEEGDLSGPMVGQLLVHERYLFQKFGVTPEFLIAMFELAGLAWHTGVIIFCAVHAKHAPRIHAGEPLQTQDFFRWSALARLFRNELPALQAFSAMRTLQHVTPGVLTPQVQALIVRLRRSKARPLKKCLRLLAFTGLRLLYAFFGAEAFLVKFRVAASDLQLACEDLRSLIPIFVFLNQLLGIVQLNIYTNQRLFLFIFGGVDSYIDPSEQRRMRVWNAALQKAAWLTYKDRPGRFLAVTLTFSDADFQKMVLDEGAP